MTSFIVISTDNSLHSVLDSIEKCCPSTGCDELKYIEPFISTGKIIKNEDGGLVYRYSSGKVESDEEEKHSLANLFQNQVAAFKTMAGVGNGTVNVFLLYNLDNTEDESNQWIFEEISKLVSKNNVNLHTVLLSFNQDKCTDTTKRASTSRIRNFIEFCKEKTALIPYSKILYLNNLDANGAVTWINKDEYEWTLPRMLGDWFMLLSDNPTASGMLTAIQSSTDIYSIGYSEYAYLPKEDFERFLQVTLERDLIEKVVLRGEPQESDEEPVIGLYKRRDANKERYREVQFFDDIEEYPTSIDCKIHHILCELEPIIQRINAGIEEEHKAKEINVLSGEDREADTCVEEPDTPEKKESLPPKLLPFTTRKDIYDYYISLLFDEDKEKVKNGDDKEFNSLRREYEETLRTVKDFKSLIADYKKYVPEDVESSKETELVSNTPMPSGCLPFVWLKKLFGNNVDTIANETITEEQVVEVVDIATLIHDKSVKISKFETERKKYTELLNRIETEEEKLAELREKADINNFALTHSSKLENSCGLARMDNYEKNISESILKEVVEEWSANEKDEENLRDKLEKILFGKIFHHVKQRWYLHWDALYEFVEPLPDKRKEEICTFIQKRSTPFINYTDNRFPHVPLTSYIYFSNNKELIVQLKGKKLSVPNINNVMAMESCHIINKICMFQIFQVDDYLLENGLTDLQESDEETNLPTEFPHPLVDTPADDTSTQSDNISNTPDKEFWGDN